MERLESTDAEKLLTWEDYWAIARRRRRWFLLPLFLGWGVIWALGWFLPAAYRSETVILVEHQRVPEHYVIPNVAVNLQERLQSMTQQILSRTRLRRIIEDFHLYPEERRRSSLDELVEQMRGDIKIDLVQAPGRQAELTAFKIYYSAPDPRVAQQVTTQLASLFIDENVRARQQQSESTTAFLENQLEAARTDLEAQEERLREFKAQYLGELPEQLQGNLQILAGLQARLQGALAGINRSEQQKLYLESLLAQYRSLQAELKKGKTLSGGLPPALDQELDRLKTLQADLSARYTERHPDVQSLKEKIAQTEKLKEQIKADLGAARDQSEEDTAPDTSPASYEELQAMSPLMQIESQLKANQLELENHRREIKELETRMGQYQARLNLTPLREQQLANLTRDYQQSRANYESLLAKKNQSELATNLEKRQQGEHFRILDPASLPSKPYRPDRVTLGWMGVVTGVLLGGIISAGAEWADDRIHSEKDCNGLVPVALLVGIPPLRTEKERRKSRWRNAVESLAATVMVTGIVAGMVAVYYWR